MSEPLSEIYWRLGAQYDSSIEQEKPTDNAKPASTGDQAATQTSLLPFTSYATEIWRGLVMLTWHHMLTRHLCRCSCSLRGWQHCGSSPAVGQSLLCTAP